MRTEPSTGGYEGPEFTEGRHTLVCTTFHRVPPNEYGQELRIGFQLVDEPEVLTDVLVTNKLTKPGRNPASKYYQITSALGMNPDDGVNSEDLIGRRCTALVSVSETGWPRLDSFAAETTRTAGRVTATKANSARNAQSEDESLAAMVDASGISDWWGMVLKEGFTRDTVVEMSAADYEGKKPADLLPTERDDLFKKLMGD